MWTTPDFRALSSTASRSLLNCLKSRWQCESITPCKGAFIDEIPPESYFSGNGIIRLCNFCLVLSFLVWLKREQQVHSHRFSNVMLHLSIFGRTAEPDPCAFDVLSIYLHIQFSHFGNRLEISVSRNQSLGSIRHCNSSNQNIECINRNPQGKKPAHNLA